MRVAAAMIGFLFLALSPSFIDWQETPDRRGEMVVYYVVTLTLLWFGLMS